MYYSVHLIRMKEYYDKLGMHHEIIDLWGAGGITTITDPKDISNIKKWIKEAKSMGEKPEAYVEYMLNKDQEDYDYFVGSQPI